MKSAKSEVNYNVSDIEIVELSVVNIPKENDFNDDNKFNISLVYQYVLKDNLFRVLTNVEICNAHNNSKYANISCGVTFFIEDLQSFFNDKEGTFLFPEGFVDRISMLAIATTRGVIFSSLKSTFPYNVILPIVHLNSLKEIPK